MPLHFVTRPNLGVFSYDTVNLITPVDIVVGGGTGPYTITLLTDRDPLWSGLVFVDGGGGTATISGTQTGTSDAGARFLVVEVEDALSATTQRIFRLRQATTPPNSAGETPSHLWRFDGKVSGDLVPSGGTIEPPEDLNAGRHPSRVYGDLDGNQAVSTSFGATLKLSSTYGSRFGRRSLVFEQSGLATGEDSVIFPRNANIRVASMFTPAGSVSSVPGLTWDFGLRLEELSGVTDPGFALRMEMRDPNGTAFATLRLTRYDYRITFLRSATPVVYTGLFAVPLATATWFNIRFGLWKAATGAVALHIDGTQVAFHQDGGGVADVFTENRIRFFLGAAQQVAGGHIVAVDNLAVLRSFQIGDYTPSTAAASFFTFSYASPPVLLYDQGDLDVEEDSVVAFSFAATGGTSTYTYVVATGLLPPGLSLAPSGAVTGTARSSGSYTVSIRTIDSLGEMTDTTVTFNIFPLLSSRFTLKNDPTGAMASGSGTNPDDEIGASDGNQLVIGTVAIRDGVAGHTESPKHLIVGGVI